MELANYDAEDLRFRSFVTETAFSLSLTKAMVAEIGLIGNEGTRTNGGNTVAALHRRGLINPDKENWSVIAEWKLSRAGKAVFEVLLVAGLITRAQKPLAEAA